jgi:PAS domain S-box-containing protein
MTWSGNRLKFSQPARCLIALSAFVAYGLALQPIFGLIGPAVGALSMLPVVLAGALLGQTFGVLSAVLLLPLHLALFPVSSPGGHVAAVLATAVLGGVVGRLRDLAVLLHRRRLELEQTLGREQDANARLQEKEAQLALAQDVAQTGSWDWNLANHTVSWSTRLFHIFGVLPGEFVPSYDGFIGLVHEDDRDQVQAHVARLLKDRGTVSFEFRVVQPGGQMRVVHANAAAMSSIDGRVEKVIGTVQDITEQRALQSRLVLADRLASVGTLAGGVAHEINNPLAYVISNLDFVTSALRAGEPIAGEELRHFGEAMSEAREGAERVRRIVKDLKSFSRADETVREAVCLERVLDFSSNIAMNEIRPRAKLVKDYRDAPLVEANESRLGQVLVNLLVNAAQAIPEGHADEHEIRLTTRTDEQGRAVIEVRDTGAGIAPEARSRIFDPFFTTKPIGVGTGLGLSICHGIVSSFGGELTFESELGKGSTFRVVLPRAVHALRPEPVRAPVEAGDRRAILIVDDDHYVATALRRLLTQTHAVEVVSDGQAALAQLAAREFDLVLCDLIMPGMSGMELHERIARERPELSSKLVFMTGGAFTSRAKEFVAAFGHRVLDKPIDADALRALIRERTGGCPLRSSAEAPSLSAA